MTTKSPHPKKISKSYQILIFTFICSLVLITFFFVSLGINEVEAIEAQYFARIDYTGEAIKNAIEATNNAMYAYESQYDEILVGILHDFNEKFTLAHGDPDLIDLDTLKQEYEIINPLGVHLYILDSTNTIIASTHAVEVGYDFSNVPNFADELSRIYHENRLVLDATAPNQHSNEIHKYGYIASENHEYLLEVGIAMPDISTPAKSQYEGLDPNIITTPNTVFLFSKSAVLLNDPEKGLVKLGTDDQVLTDWPLRMDYISRAFAEKRSFSIHIPEENRRVDYYFIPYPGEDAPSRSFVSQVLEVSTDLTPFHQAIFQRTFIIIVITIICVVLFIGMGFVITRLVVHPINQIIDDIEIIANGDYDHKIQQTKGPEFDRLETSIMKLISTLKDEIKANVEQGAILAQKNSIFSALLEVSTHGVIAVDSDWRVIAFNKVFCEMWDISEDVVHLGADGWDVLRHLKEQMINPELYMSYVHRTFDDKAMCWEGQITMSDGRTLHCTSSPIIWLGAAQYGHIWEFSDITEIARQNLLSAVLQEHLVGGFYIYDENKKILAFNQKFIDQWGLSREELEKNPTFDSLASGFALYRDSDVQRAIVEEIINDKIHSFHDEAVLVDGTILARHSTPLIDKNGVYHGRLREFIDITENVRREQALVASREILERKNALLHALLESSTYGILSVDLDWRIVAFNKVFCEMWDLSEDMIYFDADGWEVLGHVMKQMVDPETFISNCRMLFSMPDMFWNNHLHLASGKVLNSFSAPITGLDGTYDGRIWEVIDITDDLLKQQELEQAHAELVQKDSQLTLALEGSGGGLWIWDTTTELFTLTPEFAFHYQSLYEVQVIDSFISAIHPDDQEQFLNTFLATKNNSSTGIECEFRLQSNDGIWYWILCRGIVSNVNDDGISMAITGTFIDITERKKEEKALRELNRKMHILSQFTRHDIMNQLNNMTISSELLSDEVLDVLSDDASHVHIKELFDYMEQSLAAVMGQIEFSKDYVELGSQGVGWQDVNACIEKSRLILVRPPVTLMTDNLPMIFADPLLEKVVYNLIENSIRHGERVTEMKITFSVGDDNNGLLIFEDNGVGVPDEHKVRIFDRTFGKNTGLGLFLIREILSLTDITIHECGTFGHGVRFEITIPSGYWKWD